MDKISPQLMQHDRLDPQQRDEFEKAILLARQANSTFEERKDAAYTLAELNEKYEDGMPRNDISGQEKMISEIDQHFNTYKKAADVLMPPRAAFENQDKTQKSQNENIEKVPVPLPGGAPRNERGDGGRYQSDETGYGPGDTRPSPSPEPTPSPEPIPTTSPEPGPAPSPSTQPPEPL